MEERYRSKQLKFRVTEKEKEMILANAERLGFVNFRVYALKMLLDGYVFNFSLSDDENLKKLMAEVSRTGNNINQIAKQVNSTNRIHKSDLEEIKQGQQEIIKLLRQLVINTNKIINTL